MPIHILPEEVASQIAAGEVVERPASVVKELLENALDAGAHHIAVHVEKAGRRLVEIADDGSGIPAEQLTLALSRHATSKLSSSDDLFHIRTLGFRGEALASIASVSRLTITSRPPDAPGGARLLVEAGHADVLEQIGAPAGTVVRVEDLFFNVPARLKFLKQDFTERHRIDALVSRYALAYPQVRLHLFHDGQAALQTSGSGDRREALAALYGIDTARQMIEVILEDDKIKISGFTSPIAMTRSNRQEMTFFVNGRWVQDPALSAALLQAYRTLLMVGRFPLAVLFIELEPEEVDVNVHPTKAEVRFRQPDALFSTVQRAVRRALLAYSPAPQVIPAGWQSTAPQPRQIDPAWGMAAELKPDAPTEAAAGQPALLHSQESQTPQPSGQIPLLRLVGQIGAAYLVAEGPDGLYLIDQHAAHERVLYERYQQRLGSVMPSQMLLEAVSIQLSSQSAQLLSQYLPALSGLGLQVEEFGPNTFRVRSIPVLLAGADPAAAVRAVVEDFEEDETPLQAELEARLAARICKRAAVKSGQVLSTEEQQALLRDLEACQSPRTCPHGRPTMIHLSVDLLERQFGRRGAR